MSNNYALGRYCDIQEILLTTLFGYLPVFPIYMFIRYKVKTNCICETNTVPKMPWWPNDLIHGLLNRGREFEPWFFRNSCAKLPTLEIYHALYGERKHRKETYKLEWSLWNARFAMSPRENYGPSSYSDRSNEFRLYLASFLAINF